MACTGSLIRFNGGPDVRSETTTSWREPGACGGKGETSGRISPGPAEVTCAAWSRGPARRHVWGPRQRVGHHDGGHRVLEGATCCGLR